MTDNRICAATPRQSLEDQILNENEPKNEREWWACRHIKYLRDEVIAERNVDIEQLRQRVAELEERRCEVCGYAEHHREHTGCLRKQVEKLTAERDAACDLTLTTVECIKKLKAENEWRDIETAPKDGSEILLCSKKGRIANGVWMTATDRVGAWLWPYIKVEPTHWMPLHKPPAMAQGEQE